MITPSSISPGSPAPPPAAAVGDLLEAPKPVHRVDFLLRADHRRRAPPRLRERLIQLAPRRRSHFWPADEASYFGSSLPLTVLTPSFGTLMMTYRKPGTRSCEAKPSAFRSPFSLNTGFRFKTLPSVLATRTISLSKFTSGSFSATFHALISFSKSMALVMTPFSGISVASFLSSTEPFQVLVTLSGVGSAANTGPARNITAASESHLRDNIVGLLRPGCHS